jgi:hypothetical protein
MNKEPRGSWAVQLRRLLIADSPFIANYPSLLHDPSCPLPPPHPPRIQILYPFLTPLWNLTSVKPKNDLASHPLLSSLQSCDSPEAVLTVLRDQIPAFNQSQNRDDGLTKWVIPTVNVLYTFSATVGQGVGLVNIEIFCREECLL